MPLINPYEGKDIIIEPQDENPGHPYLAAGLQFGLPMLGIPWGPPGIGAMSALGGLGAAYLRNDPNYGLADMATDFALGAAGGKFALPAGKTLLRTFGREATVGGGFGAAQTAAHNLIHGEDFDKGEMLANIGLGAGLGGVVGTGMHALLGRGGRARADREQPTAEYSEPAQMDLPLGERPPTPPQFDTTGQGNLFSNEARFGAPPPPPPPPPTGTGIGGGGGEAARQAMDRAVRLVRGRIMRQRGEGEDPGQLLNFLRQVDEPTVRTLMDVWGNKNLTPDDLMAEIMGRVLKSAGRTRSYIGRDQAPEAPTTPPPPSSPPPPPVSHNETPRGQDIHDRVVAKEMAEQGRDLPDFEDLTGAVVTPPPQAPPSPAGAAVAAPPPRRTGPLMPEDIVAGPARQVTKPQKGKAIIYVDPKTGQKIIIARFRSDKEFDAAMDRFDPSVIKHTRLATAREVFNMEAKGEAVPRVIENVPPRKAAKQEAPPPPPSPPKAPSAPPAPPVPPVPPAASSAAVAPDFTTPAGEVPGAGTYRITSPEINGGITVNDKGIIVASTPVFRRKFVGKPVTGLLNWMQKKWPTTKAELTDEPLASLVPKRGAAPGDEGGAPPDVVPPSPDEEAPYDLPNFEDLSPTRPTTAAVQPEAPTAPAAATEGGAPPTDFTSPGEAPTTPDYTVVTGQTEANADLIRRHIQVLNRAWAQESPGTLHNQSKWTKILKKAGWGDEQIDAYFSKLEERGIFSALNEKGFRTFNGLKGEAAAQQAPGWKQIMDSVDASAARQLVEKTGGIKAALIRTKSAKRINGEYQTKEEWEVSILRNNGTEAHRVRFPKEYADTPGDAELQGAKHFFHSEAIGRPRISFQRLESALEMMRQEGGIGHEADLGMVPDALSMAEAKEQLALFLAMARRGKLPGDLTELRRSLGLEGHQLGLGGPLAKQDEKTGKWIPAKGRTPEETRSIQARVKTLLDEYLYMKPDDRDAEDILRNVTSLGSEIKRGGVLTRGTAQEGGGFKEYRGRRGARQQYANITSRHAHVWNYWERTGKLKNALDEIDALENDIPDEKIEALISQYARGGKKDPATQKVEDFSMTDAPPVDKMTETGPTGASEFQDVTPSKPATTKGPEAPTLPDEQRRYNAFEWAHTFGKNNEDAIHAMIKLGDSDVIIAQKMAGMFDSVGASSKWSPEMRQRFIKLLRDGGRYGNHRRQEAAKDFAVERGVYNAILQDIDKLSDEAILSGTIGKMLSNLEPAEQRKLLGFIRASRPVREAAAERVREAIRGGEVTPAALRNADQEITLRVAVAMGDGVDPADSAKMWAIINDAAEEHAHVRQALDVWQKEVGTPTKIIQHFVTKARTLADEVGVDVDNSLKAAKQRAAEKAEAEARAQAEEAHRQAIKDLENNPEQVTEFTDVDTSVPPPPVVRVKADTPPPSYMAEVGENINILMPDRELPDRMAVKQLLLDAWRAESDSPVRVSEVPPQTVDAANLVLSSLNEPAGFTLEIENGKLIKRPIPGQAVAGETPQESGGDRITELVQDAVTERPQFDGIQHVYMRRGNAEAAAARINRGLSEAQDQGMQDPEFAGKRYFVTKKKDGTGYTLELRPINAKNQIQDSSGFLDITDAARMLRDAYGAIRDAVTGKMRAPDTFERERVSMRVPRDQWQSVPPAKPREQHHDKRAIRDRRFKQSDFDALYRNYDKDTADMLADLYVEKAPELFDHLRNIQPQPRTKALADREAVALNKLFPKGTVKNAEQTVSLMAATARARIHAAELAAKFDAGSLTMGEQLELPRALNDWYILALNDKGNSSELGRALAVRRWFKVEMADAMRYEPDKMLDVVKSYRARMKLMAEQLRTATTPEDQSAILNRFASGDWHNKLRSYLFGNLLSSPKTWIRNTVGNTMRLVFEMGSEPFTVMAAEGARGLKKVGVNGKVIDKLAASDFDWDNIPAEWVGMVDGLKEGLTDFNFTMKYGFNPQMLRHIDTPTLLEAPRAEFKGGAFNPYNFIPRVMEATDAFFRRAAYRKYMTGWAYSNAKRDMAKLGRMTPAAKRNFLEKRMADYMIDVPKDVESQAWDYASRMVFQEDPPEFARRLMALKHAKHGKLGATFWDFFVPFVRTPANILRQGLFEFSPLGMLPAAERSPTGWQLGPSKANAALVHALETGDAQGVARAYGRALLGSMVGLAGFMAYKSGKLTAGIPKDEGARAQFYAEKKIPNAFHVPIGPNGKYIGHSFLGPSSILLSVIAAAGDGMDQWVNEAKKKPWEESTAFGGKIITSLIYAITEQSYLQGLKYLGDLLNNPEESAVTLAKQAGGFAVPLSSFNRAANAAMDPTVRTAGTATEGMQMSMLGKGNELAPRINRWGQEVKRTGEGALGALNRFASPTENADAGPIDPVDIEMGRIGAKIGDPKRVERILNRDVTMPKEIAPYVQKFRRKALYGALSSLIQSPRYQSMKNDYAKLDLVERERRRVTKQVSEQIKPVLVKYILDKARKNSKQRVIPSADAPRGQQNGESSY